MKTTQTGKPILDALLSASESLDNKTPETDNQRNETRAGEWITQAELDKLEPIYFDLRQTAITKGGSWNYCGFNAWFRTSGKEIIK